MLVVEVDVVDVQARERLLDGRVHVLGPSAYAAGAVLRKDVSELRREHDLVAMPLDRLTDERLVLARPRAVDVGGVEEEDAELERPVNRRERLVLVRLAVPGRHAHAAEALLRDLELVSKRARLHAGGVSAAAIVAAGHGGPKA